MENSQRATLIRRPVGMLLTGVSLISFSAIFVQLAATASVTIGFYRNFFGLLFLVPFILIRRKPWFTDSLSLLLPLVAGLVFFLDLTVWHQSIRYVGPGIATLLGNFQVFFVALFGILFLRERLSWQFACSVPIALAGLALIVGMPSLDGGSDYGKGILLGLLTAVFYSIFLLIVRGTQSRPKALSPEVNLAYLSFSAALFFFLAIGFSAAPLAIPSATALWSLLGYGLVTHFIGWVVISGALPRIRASVAGLVLLLQPILSFVWEVIFFQKRFSPAQVGGALIALFAIYLGMKGQQTSS